MSYTARRALSRGEVFSFELLALCPLLLRGEREERRAAEVLAELLRIHLPLLWRGIPGAGVPAGQAGGGRGGRRRAGGSPGRGGNVAGRRGREVGPEQRVRARALLVREPVREGRPRVLRRPLAHLPPVHVLDGRRDRLVRHPRAAERIEALAALDLALELHDPRGRPRRLLHLSLEVDDALTVRLALLLRGLDALVQGFDLPLVLGGLAVEPRLGDDVLDLHAAMGTVVGHVHSAVAGTCVTGELAMASTTSSGRPSCILAMARAAGAATSPRVTARARSIALVISPILGSSPETSSPRASAWLRVSRAMRIRSICALIKAATASSSVVPGCSSRYASIGDASPLSCSQVISSRRATRSCGLRGISS